MVARCSDEDALAAALAWRAHGSARAAGRVLGISDSCVVRRAHRAAERGLLGFEPVLPGFVAKSISTRTNGDGKVISHTVTQAKEPGAVFATPKGHSIKGVSALIDAEGREIVKWVKTRNGEIGIEETIELLKTAFADTPPAQPQQAPEHVMPEVMTLLPCNDWHLGMYAWGEESGEDWGLAKAERIISEAMEFLIERAPSSEQLVILGGGDLMHADNKSNQTRSGHTLDVDGRYGQVLQAALRLKVRLIDLALTRHQTVIVRILRGNHDDQSAVAISHYLSAWYRAEPRVKVDTDPSLFWYHRFGRCFFAATHGHEAKVDKLPLIMASARPQDWGETKFRFVHTFHIHHFTAREFPGVICESHQAPIPRDAWHAEQGFHSGRSVKAITYSASRGEVARINRNIGADP